MGLQPMWRGGATSRGLGKICIVCKLCALLPLKPIFHSSETTCTMLQCTTT